MGSNVRVGSSPTSGTSNYFPRKKTLKSDDSGVYMQALNALMGLICYEANTLVASATQA